ncbi:MAG: DEAD/DEAH box helicase [Acidimicrobiales bacterium]
MTDDRIEFVQPSDFRADLLAEELTALRPDAVWNRLDLAGRAARHADLPPQVHPAVVDALQRNGRLPLYVHQAQAIEAAMSGGHVVQATSAGSGKSLGFLVPVLDRLIRSSTATAILVFPMKALANDQVAALARLNATETRWVDTSSFDLVLDEDAPRIRVTRYHGATPEHERTLARHQARLLITTPDMLHASLLRWGAKNYKDGTSWERILKGLQFVVLDELHAYQGVFGSNVALVLRRLRRLAHHHGSSPRFLGASATVDNPVEQAEKLTGLAPFHLVDDDGSPMRRRVVLICNPPERGHDAPSTKAQAAKKEEADSLLDLGRIAPQTVAIELVGAGALASTSHLPVRTIAFCRSRNTVFQLARRIQNNLKEGRRADLAQAVAAYAATFVEEDRAEAEGKLRDGSTLAIVSTSALELGIDIPDLSLCVLLGYPGQISSFRQRIGRVGRAGEGLAVLIVGDDPLQQFLAREPETLQRLLSAPAETVVINPDAVEIARRYGLAPAQEELGGIAFEDKEFFGDVVDEWLEGCTGAATATRRGIAYWRVQEFDDPYPGLRGIGGRSIQVQHQSGRDFKAIGTVDAASAPRDAFVPAIWSAADGSLYEVKGFDPKKAEVYCDGPVEAGFLTRGVTVDRVEILDAHRPSLPVAAGEVGFGRLSITRQVFSYVEQHFSGVERKKPVERAWPPVEFTTDGLYVDIDPSWADVHPLEASVKGVEHLLLAAAPALIACDPHDVEATSTRTHVFVYDSFGGGIRLTEPAFDRFSELVALAHEIVATCPCDSGCPSCVLLSRRPEGNRELSKAGALAVLGHLQDVVKNASSGISE